MDNKPETPLEKRNRMYALAQSGSAISMALLLVGAAIICCVVVVMIF